MVKETTITSWDMFRELADKLDIGPAWAVTFLYRGQARAEWALKPSLQRVLSPTMTERQAVDLELEAVKWFQARAHHFMKANDGPPAPNQLPSWWALMQHHGAPTRLLDWTASLYVAAYFAVESSIDQDGAVWIVHAAAINQVLSEKYQKDVDSFLSTTSAYDLYLAPERPEDIIIATRTLLLERMIPQQAYFSVCRNVLGDQQRIIEELSSSVDKSLLRKLVIPADKKREFLRKLRVMNVTASTLYPGLDGVGRATGELITLCS